MLNETRIELAILANWSTIALEQASILLHVIMQQLHLLVGDTFTVNVWMCVNQSQCRECWGSSRSKTKTERKIVSLTSESDRFKKKKIKKALSLINAPKLKSNKNNSFFIQYFYHYLKTITYKCICFRLKRFQQEQIIIIVMTLC